MRRNAFFLLVLFLLFGYGQLHAQDTVFRLSPAEVTESGYLRFPPITQWKFKKGNNAEWAKQGFDDSQWVQMDSAQVTNLWYDERDVFEGWFRFKFQLEPGFEQLPNFLFSTNGAAVDVYLDGKRVAQFGEMGDALADYRINRRTTDFINVEPGVTYTMAIHFYDHVGGVTQFLDKRLNVLGTNSFLLLLSEAKAVEREARREKSLARSQFTFGLTTVLSFLMWLVWGLNRRHKHLLLLAILTTANTCGQVLDVWNLESYPRGGVLFNAEFNAFSMIISVASGVILTVVLPMLLALLFTGIIPKWLKMTGALILFVLAPIITLIYSYEAFAWTVFLPALIVISAAGLCIYYLIRYRKEIRGAKWAIVIGLILCAVLQAGTVVGSRAELINREIQTDLIYLYTILLPVSFVVYVALWLQETQRSERKKAQEVARVSRENQQILKEQNQLLEAEVAKRTGDLKKSLADLKETQSQLIHSEKMASLGELTAGIAHEIQNPLNFVNNFSEVSGELIEEMKEEIKNKDFKEVEAIADDLRDNLVKINHHGKRADGIVRGMLQHSRSGDGTKEPTDLNKLVDEYLRLAYHGLRAKDKDFNANMVTEYENSLASMEVVPQQIGRVMLNLITNAFHAVKARSQKEPQGYEPTVWVGTRKTDKGVEISVRDNGGGIPEEIREKIFQPFFTTKPTGEGTGLGLSMSYDIVTKGHGGTLALKTEAGKGAEFLINLPL